MEDNLFLLLASLLTIIVLPNSSDQEMDSFPPSTASMGGFGGRSEDGVVVQAIHSAGLTRVVHAQNARDREGTVE